MEVLIITLGLNSLFELISKELLLIKLNHLEVLFIPPKGKKWSFDNLEEGLPRDLTYHIGRSFGLNLKHGNDLRQLWRYALGTDSSGGYVTGSGAAVGERLSSDDANVDFVWHQNPLKINSVKEITSWSQSLAAGYFEPAEFRSAEPAWVSGY